MNKLSLSYLVFLFLIFSFISCREEMIAPGNIAGNINEPVKTNSSTSYTFALNAENLSTSVHDLSPFYALRTSYYIKILDYSAGSVEVTVAGRSNVILLHYVFTSNITNIADVLEGSSPEFVNIRFNNFTGKVRFELNKL